MKLNPYPEYKDSGVPWLGKIPKHWEVRRLKFLCHNLNEQISEKQPGETYIALEHVESWTGRISLPDDEITFDSQVKRFQPGDVLFGKLRPYLAKVTQPQFAGVCVGEFLVLRATENVSADFLEQKLRSKRTIDLINSSTFGTKMPRANWTFIGNLKLAYPSAEEQRAISRFLKNKTSQINKFIRNKRRLIELLKEQKQNIINQVVTGKCEVRRMKDENGKERLKAFPTSPLKLRPSNVEWLGDIPKHWEVRRIKFLFAEREERKGDMEFELLSFSRSKGLVPFFEISSKPPSAEDLSKYKVCRPGHLLMNRMQAWSGMFTDVVIEGIVSPDYSVFEPIRPMSVAYFSYLFKTKHHINEFTMASKGIGDGFNRLYTPAFGAIRTLCPPVDEQNEIVEFIKQETEIIDAAISRAEREIELMREYRARLISDVVTGQVDVRGIEVPEVAEDELSALEEDDAVTDEMMDNEEAMDDEND